MASELAFESLLLAHEATAGTAVNPPTHYAKLSGTLDPQFDWNEVAESDGTLGEFTAADLMREYSNISAEGNADVNMIPFYAAMLYNGSVTSPSTPGGATNARLWTQPRIMTSNGRKTATAYWGDINVQQLQAPFFILQEMTLSADASGTGGATMSISGIANKYAKTNASSVPSYTSSPTLIPAFSQVWVDTTSAIGTTEITGRFISGSATLRSGLDAKWLAVGPSGSNTFSSTGIGKTTQEMTLAFHLEDMTQFDYIRNNAYLKVRWRLNGPEIETGFRYYTQIDIYGKASALSWTTLGNTNRAIQLTVRSYNSATAKTAGHDAQLVTQNARTTL